MLNSIIDIKIIAVKGWALQNIKGGFTFKMKKLINISALVVVLAISVLFLGVNTAQAQENESENNSNQTGQTVEVESYKYEVQPGDNQSLLVRRSIQIYAESAGLEVSEAVAMYCETNVVQDMGGTWLEVGDNVAVPISTIQKYIDNSVELSDRQMRNWRTWADKADFNISHIQPTNLNAAEESVENTERQRREEDPDNEDGTGAEEQEATNEEANASQTNDSDDASSWWIWIGLAAIVLGGAYWVRSRNQTNNSSK